MLQREVRPAVAIFLGKELPPVMTLTVVPLTPPTVVLTSLELMLAKFVASAEAVFLII